MEYSLLPQKFNQEGKIRTVGFELEFSGMELFHIAEVVKGIFGGSIRKKSNVKFEISNTPHGDFIVELDARLLKKMAREDYLQKWGIKTKDNIQDRLGDIINSIAKTVVPVEIAMPPVAIDQIEVFKPLIKELRHQKAEGTESSWINAFGFHINVEVSDLTTKSILPTFKAFLLLYDWLVKYLDVNLSRKLTPFILPFPQTYVDKVLHQNYTPSITPFIEDYLTDNPTRNRPLDLIPLFIHIDKELVGRYMDISKSKGRPTYHFRLPNSNIHLNDWIYSNEWNAWVLVEKLATNRDLLHQLQKRYLKKRSDKLLPATSEWIETINSYLYEHFETNYRSNGT